MAFPEGCEPIEGTRADNEIYTGWVQKMQEAIPDFQKYWFVFQPIVPLGAAVNGPFDRYEGLIRFGEEESSVAAGYRVLIESSETVNEATFLTLSLLSEAIHRLPHDTTVHINISPEQLTPELANIIRVWVRVNAIPNNRVLFELTEGYKDKKYDIADYKMRVNWLVKALPDFVFAVDDIPHVLTRHANEVIHMLPNFGMVKTSSEDLVHDPDLLDHVLQQMILHHHLVLVVEKINDVVELRRLIKICDDYPLDTMRIYYQGVVANHIISRNSPVVV